MNPRRKSSTKVSLDSQDDGVSHVSFNSDNAWTGRLGARFKGRYEVSGRPLEPCVRANLWHTFSGTDSVTFAGAERIDTEQRSSSADLGVVHGLSPRQSSERLWRHRLQQ
ncbi:autotransporter domain-containing protein [Pseudomonas sp. S2_F03]